MSTYEKAAHVRDALAERLLDDGDVISVGLRNVGDDYQVGVTATHPVVLPLLPADLRDVTVSVAVTARLPVPHAKRRGSHTKWLRRRRRRAASA